MDKPSATDKNGGIDVKIPKEIIVWSCRECNLVASAKIFKNFAEKKAYIKVRIQEKYKRYIKRPIWTDEEINELSGRLRETTFFLNEITKVIKRRILH